MNDRHFDRIVLLCTTDPQVLASADALAAVGYNPIPCASLKDVQRDLGDATAAVVLDAELPKNQTFGIYRFLRKETTVPFLILLPSPGSEAPWAMEVEHGEREEYARKPISAAELVLRLDALMLHSGRFTADGGAVGSGGVALAEQSAQSAAAVAGYGKVICVFGAHGGVGKTMLAVHIAVGLAKFTDARVAFIDGDLWMGDSLVSLNLTGTRSILDATVHGIPRDPEVWTRVLVDHPSGVKVLPAPAHLEDVERVPEGAISAAAHALRRYFDFVVVDLDDTPSEGALSVLEAADQVLIVLTPELGSVRNTLRLLTAGARIGIGERIRVVLNRAEAGLDTRQVQSILPRPISAQIPSDGRLFVAAANLGVTVYDVDPTGRTAARRALEALARDVFEFGRPKVARRSGSSFSLGGLLRKRS